jgi:hypothetical protein
MSAPAPALDRERLVKLVGMFGSDHPGERSNAAAAADKLVRQAGLRWPDVILPALPPPRREREISSDSDAIEFCIEHPDELSSWEFKFVWSLHHQRYALTPKQRQTLVGIVEKVQRAKAGAAT